MDASDPKLRFGAARLPFFADQLCVSLIHAALVRSTWRANTMVKRPLVGDDVRQHACHSPIISFEALMAAV
jgi:hypothetical protein